MRNVLLRLAIVAVTVTVGWAQPVAAKTVSLSQDWRFHKGEVQDGGTVSCDDSNWRRVVVPHDFSIEDGPNGMPFAPKTVGGGDSGYIPGGIGWYRRHLKLDSAMAKQVLTLDFEAVYMDAQIWVNGEHLADHHYGYTAFRVDLTGHVHPGDNVIAVRVDHQDSSSRWYAGSGIIRPVTLEILPTVHIGSDGPTITTPDVTAATASVRGVTPLVNDENKPVSAVLETRILDTRGKVVAVAITHRNIGPGVEFALTQDLKLVRPHLWDTQSPYLYRLVQSLRVGELRDRRQTTFGVRTIRLDPIHGLLLNGRPILLRGGNIHHDSYMLGAASFPRAEARKLEWMKAAGYNAVRSAHNPLSQASLDAADRLGLLVIDEAFDAWSVPKRPKDYARFFATDWQDDIRSLVMSGRNHPSVLAWSIGNEIPEQGKPEGATEAAMLAAHVRKLDPARPITQAINVDDPGTAEDFAQLDIGGYNYLPQVFERDHKTFPNRMMMTTESYPANVFDYWQPVKSMPWVIGDFVWTAVDYLGEASIGGVGYAEDWQSIGPYPWHLAWCGEIDAIGRLRPNAYYRQIVWGNSKHQVAAFVRRPGSDPWAIDGLNARNLQWVMPDIHPSWTWRGYEGKPVEVVVYSALPEVELFLNGHSLGRKKIGEADKDQTSFTVRYEPGTLTAVGYRDGKKADEWTLHTTGAPAAIKLSVDRSHLTDSGMDIGYVTALLVDAEGHSIYGEASDKLLRFTVAGVGVLAGVGNGNPYGTESFQSGIRTTYHGEAVAAIRAGTKPGTITVKVQANGLVQQEIVLHSSGT